MTEPTIRIHIGSHKTATTYIQETLLLNRARSAAAGLAYLPLHSVRIPIRQELERRQGERTRPLQQLIDAAVGRPVPVSRLFALDMLITMSEENILGQAHESFVGGLYPNAELGLRVLQDAVPPRRPLELWLAVRSYAPYLTSMYAEALRHGSYMPLTQFLANHRQSPGSWVTLVDTIRGIFPQARLVIWRYEDFASLEHGILERLSGVPSERLHRLAAGKPLLRASAEAVEAMMEAAPKLSSKHRIYKMLALQDKYPNSTSSRRFDPWSADEKAAMAERYERDVAELRARDDVEFLG